MALRLSITTPEGPIHQGEVQSVVVPAHDGEMGILPGHAPLIGTLGAGALRCRAAAGGAEAWFFVAGGFIQVFKDQVTVLATQAAAASAIDAAKAEAELKRLRDESLPPKATIEARRARSDQVRAAEQRLKVASRAAK